MGNLWDVTDKDIDRFSQALLGAWLEEGARPQCGGDGGGASRDVSAAVAAARAACRLPHLIGAAPVCYGIPTDVAAAAALPANF